MKLEITNPASKVPLPASRLSAFLKSNGLIVKERFWEQVEDECSRGVASERSLVFDQVPWNGLIVISISFSRGDVYKQLYWGDLKDANIDPHVLYVNGIIIEIKYFVSSRISLSSKQITSSVTPPACRVRLLVPSIRQVERSWEVMFSIGEKIEMYNRKQIAILKREIISIFEI